MDLPPVGPQPRTPRRIEYHLVRFASLLRRLGVPVTTAEVVDAVDCLADIDVTCRSQFRAALRATLVKGEAERALFQEAFDLYFTTPRAHAEILAEGCERRRRREEAHRRADAEVRLFDRALELTPEQRETYAAMSREERDGLRTFLARTEAGNKVDESFIPLVERLVRAHLDRRRRQGGEDPLPTAPESGDPTLDAITERLAWLRGRGGGAPGSDRAPTQGGDAADLADGLEDVELLFTDLRRVAAADLPRLRRLIARLSRRLATQLARRLRPGRKRRHLDLRRTIRACVATGGLPFRLRYRAPRARRPRLLLICDVSASMARWSRFVLQFAYGLAGAVGHLEAFAFADDLEHLTPFFQQRRPFETTMGAVMAHSRQWAQGTNLGRALGTLLEGFRRALRPDTVVLVLSDSQTVAAARAEAALETLSRRVRRVIWLNPLHRADWERGAAATLRRHCEMHECRTAADLYTVVQTLTLGRRRGIRGT